MLLPRGEEKKKEKGTWRCPCIHEHFCQLRKNLSPFSFLSFWGENILVGPRRKHSCLTIYFISFPLNQTHSKKVFIFIFFLKFFIHLVSPSNKYTLKNSVYHCKSPTSYLSAHILHFPCDIRRDNKWQSYRF